MRNRNIVVAMLIGATLAAVACGSSKTGTKATPAATAYAPVIHPASFTNQITNAYFPLVPGTTFVYDETVDGETQKVETTVTHDTKTIMGVSCVVVHDVATAADGSLVEDTYDWYAQDAEGNVWYFGEDTKAYEGGTVKSTSGSWEAGVDGAQPGIVMEAGPKVGDSYRQEYYAGEAEDAARVTGVSGSVTVPYGSYQNLLVTEETTRLEPNQVEEKYYARDVGFVYGKLTKGGSEETRLVSVTRE